MLRVILSTLICGTLFTCIGYLIAIFTKKENKRTTSFLLAFASGSMLSIVFIDLFPELIEISQNFKMGIYIALFLILVFYLLIFYLHQLFDNCHHKGEDCHIDEEHHICHDRAHAHQFVESIEHHASFLQAGLILFFAMCIHNFPEGISLGVTFSLSKMSGYTFALLIGIHNIVVGFSMTLPFLHSKMKKINILWIVLLSTLPLLIGSILGFYFGGLNNIVLLIVMSFSIAAILYVVFTELIPQAYYMTKSKYISLFLLVGILISGLLILI